MLIILCKFIIAIKTANNKVEGNVKTFVISRLFYKRYPYNMLRITDNLKIFHLSDASI